MKLDISDIQQALKEAQIAPEQQQKVISHLEDVIKELEENKQENAAPKQKYEFGVILYAPELIGKEYTASVYQVPQNSNHNEVLAKISEAVRTSNEKSKKKKNIIETIGDAFGHLKRKFIKEKNINLKTKQVVTVLISNNKLL